MPKRRRPVSLDPLDPTATVWCAAYTLTPARIRLLEEECRNGLVSERFLASFRQAAEQEVRCTCVLQDVGFHSGVAIGIFIPNDPDDAISDIVPTVGQQYRLIRCATNYEGTDMAATLIIPPNLQTLWRRPRRFPRLASHTNSDSHIIDLLAASYSITAEVSAMIEHVPNPGYRSPTIIFMLSWKTVV
ncbi:hypothetical protein BJ508DRAFT_326330 [Ascobolus immersus RN42]|uniref:Uncharacterized protein n=1 Tax=Ascobolus immersus RN42 TaxID=1160509 RepID=A0A3N4I6D8_ASCIM|nr:hypothetical protein BJ508DRAFT_326330 [Ascobolus immersus RN42]